MKTEDNPSVSGAQGPFNVRMIKQLLDNGYVPVLLEPKSKKPLSRAWQKTVPTLEQLSQQLKCHPQANLGIRCGDGALLNININNDELFERLRTMMPSGSPCRRGQRGGAFFVRCPDARIRNRKVRRAGTNEVELELLASSSHCVLPPSIHPKTEISYVWLTHETLFNTALASLPEMTAEQIDELCRVAEGTTTTATTTRYGAAALEGECAQVCATEEGGRNEQLRTSALKIGSLVKGGEISATEAKEGLRTAARKTGLDDQEIDRTISGGFEDAKPRGPDRSLTRRYMWIMEAGAYFDRESRKLVPREAVNASVRHQLPVDNRGRLIAADNVLLMDPTSKFDALCYRPGQPEVIIEGKRRLLNVYQVPTLQPIEGDAGPFLNHVQYMFGWDFDAHDETAARAKYDETACEHFLDVLAFIVQHPGRKIKHMPVIGGAEGLGKSLTGQTMRPIVGDTNYTEPDNSEILKGRHGYLAQKRLAVIHELRVGKREDVANALKTVITEDTIRVELKYVNPHEIENVATLIAFTNHRDAVAIHEGDRRYFLYWSDAEKRDPAYYKHLCEWLDLRIPANPNGTNRGAAILLSWLLKRDITRFSPDAPPPMTAAKQEVAEASRWEPLVLLEELHEARGRPFDRDVVRLTDVLQSFRARFDGLQRLSRPKLMEFLRKRGGGPLGDDTGTRYIADGAPCKARLWAVRDLDKWRAAAQSDEGKRAIGDEVYRNTPHSSPTWQALE